jgi:hypothetical protein
MKQVKVIIYFLSFIMMAAGFTLLYKQYGNTAVMYGLISTVGTTLYSWIDFYKEK